MDLMVVASDSRPGWFIATQELGGLTQKAMLSQLGKDFLADVADSVGGGGGGGRGAGVAP